MLLTILITAAIAFIVGYFVGANNPLASVKAAIAAKAKAEVSKL